MKIRRARGYRSLTIALVVLSLLGQACTLSLIKFPELPELFPPLGGTSAPTPIVSPATPQPMAQTTFVVMLPEPLTSSEDLVPDHAR
jgi:hypothetical protein